MLRHFRYALILLALLGAGQAWAHEALDHDQAGFILRVNGLDVGYNVFPVFALPGEKVSVTAADVANAFTLQASGGTWQTTGVGQWSWTAPLKPGHYPLDIRRTDGADMRLEAFVMVPAQEVRHGVLKGYRIGHYPAHPLNGLAIYREPTGFVEVTPELAAVHVTPHFTLGEFLCKQTGDFPKYLVLRPLLLLKLETLMAHLESQGISADAVHVMSGYRTPWYNARLGNVPYSRHMWGDAADIYIEASAVAGADGRSSGHYLDSTAVAADLQKLLQQSAFASLIGGLGVYPETGNHPPFVHVDARGFSANW
ncbi:MAG: D-Ala-D-Ala carboxypeptidase family metallohydrolase [Bacillota bacterium]